MNILKSFKKDVFSIREFNFEQRAMDLFYFQAQNNEIYNVYIKSLNKDPNTVFKIRQIPFMPIDFFKNHKIKTSSWKPVTVFQSSGTTNQLRSKHYIEDMDFYHSISREIFKIFYGNLSDYHIQALLPSYLERSNSSLVAMVDHFIKESKSPKSGFYLNNHQDLVDSIGAVKKEGGKGLLLGVTFALLDLAQENELDLSDYVVMETGGMKGRREEMVRTQVHDVLKKNFKVSNIHSEYGMTEILSQAYAKEEGKFQTPPWMRVLIRDLNDPFAYLENGRNGGINIIDLANIHSCAFIETSDIGLMHPDNRFEVLGRFDNSDIRGCNLMALFD